MDKALDSRPSIWHRQDEPQNNLNQNDLISVGSHSNRKKDCVLQQEPLVKEEVGHVKSWAGFEPTRPKPYDIN